MRAQHQAATFLAMTPAMRMRIEATVEHLLALLDEFDGDPDLEPANDDEPSLGWTYSLDHRPVAPVLGADEDRELEPEHDEDGGDDEPSLGSLSGLVQQGDWGAAGYTDGDDREWQDEGCCPVEDDARLLHMMWKRTF